MPSCMYNDRSPVVPALGVGIGAGALSNGIGAWWPVAVGIGLGVALLVYWIASKAKSNS